MTLKAGGPMTLKAGGPMTVKKARASRSRGGPMRLRTERPFSLKISGRRWSLQAENRHHIGLAKVRHTARALSVNPAPSGRSPSADFLLYGSPTLVRKQSATCGFSFSKKELQMESHVSKEGLMLAAARLGLVRPSVAAIARAAGLSEATIRAIFAGRPTVSAHALRRVHVALGVLDTSTTNR